MKEQLIPVTEFCEANHIQISLITTLNDYGIIELVNMQSNFYITAGQLPDLEKIITLHDELGINPEGIETINHLLKKIKAMQIEINQLKDRLNFYED